jgi:ribosomal-protein-alanine N-acetyltransferase
MRADDVPGLFALHADAEAARLFPRRPATSMEQIEAMFARLRAKNERRESLGFAMTMRGDDTFIGVVGFARFDEENSRAELAWELSRAHWGRGLMAEAAARVVSHGFEALRLHRLEAHVDPRNERSIRLAERLGFVREGVLRENYAFEGAYYDTVIYAKLAPA